MEAFESEKLISKAIFKDKLFIELNDHAQS